MEMSGKVQGEVRIDRLRLEQIMKSRGFTVRGLADRAGLHYNAIVRIKREQSTSFAGLESLCNALECHPFDLIVAEGYPEPFLAEKI